MSLGCLSRLPIEMLKVVGIPAPWAAKVLGTGFELVSMSSLIVRPLFVQDRPVPVAEGEPRTDGSSTTSVTSA